MMVELITDRTQADVNYANANRDSAMPLKGAYNAEDFNRVGTVLNYLSGRLYALGYGFNPRLRTDFATTENMSYQAAANYLSMIKQLRYSYVTLPTAPELPAHIHDLFVAGGHVWANNIELTFIDVELLINKMIVIFHRSGTIKAGQVKLRARRN